MVQKFQNLPIQQLLNLRYKVAKLPIVQILNITLIIAGLLGVYKNIILKIEINKQSNVLDILKSKSQSIASLDSLEEFNSLIRYKDIIIDQYVSEYSLLEPSSSIILAKYSMSLKGSYSNFINYLHYVNGLRLIETIHSFTMKNESDYIRMNLNLDVLYEKN